MLDCSHNRIIEITEIKSLTGLRTVCFGFNQIVNIEPLKHLNRVRELDLQRNRISSIPVDSLSCLFNLQRLNISFNGLTEFSKELCSLEGLKELNLSNNKISVIEVGKVNKMCGLEILNLASNNFDTVGQVKGIADFKCLKNLNMLSTPLFVMKQKEEKEAIKKSIIDMVSTLQIINCEELVKKPVQIECKDTSEPIKYIFPDPKAVEEVKGGQNDSIKTIDVEITYDPKDNVMKAKPIQSPKDKNKKESESVICIIEEEWNKEMKRLKDTGRPNPRLTCLEMYMTNYKRVPKSVIDKRGPSFDVKKANTYCVESGHAEIESNRILLIFGNALEVLQREEFHDTVEEIYIEYVLS